MEWFHYVVDYSPALAAGIAGTLAILAVAFKLFGITAIGDRSKLVDDGKLAAVSSGVDAIKAQLGGMEKRISTVEGDVVLRATKDEVHRLELSFTRMEGKLESQGMTILSTANAISRIEDFMYSAATSARGAK